MARDWAWALAVTPVQKLVITALAERADDTGNCFPSLAHLAGMTGLARSTVVCALSELEAARRIVRVRGGGRKSTRYHLLVDEPVAVHVSRGFVQEAASRGSTDWVVRDADASSQPNGPQPSDRRTATARWADTCGPTDGPVPEAVVLPADLSNPANGCQQSEGRTAAVRPPDPNRQYNRHLTVSASTADVVDDTQPRDREAKGTHRPTPIPPEWRPSERVFAWAVKQGMTRSWVEAQVGEFLVYWGDAGERRKSWDATFINRLQVLQAHQGKRHDREPEARLADKDYRSGATPLDQIPWYRPPNDG